MNEEPKNEQAAPEEAHAAEAENFTGEKKEAVSYGKFKNADALYAAYNSLQAEFTKRCQRLKELEAAAERTDKQSPVPERTEMPEQKGEGITQREREEILKGYLKDILGQKTGAIIMDGAGTGLKTPVSRPKTVEEAGTLFKDLLGGKNKI